MHHEARRNKLAAPLSLSIGLTLFYFFHAYRDASNSILRSSLHPASKTPQTNSSNVTTNNSSLPVALRAFHTYREQHSHTVLNEEYNRNTSLLRDERKFAVAYFWCPQRLGNILHSFFNTIVWAMIHNRTVLWKYHESDQVSSQEQCEELLKLAQWFPSFDEWEQKLQHLTDVVPVSLTNFTDEEGHPIVLYPQITDVLVERKDIARNGWIEDPSNERHMKYLKKLPSIYQRRTIDLYSDGKYFLYGMLYSNIFELQIPSKTLEFGQNISRSVENPPLSIAVHSRHTVGADDGTYVEVEKRCLSKLITNLKAEKQSCEVLIMSDRSKTIDLLIEWLLAKNCTATTANHSVVPKINDLIEHGPWSGAGFLLDLQIMGAAESGVVGDEHRSSTALVIYQVDFNRRLRAFERSTEERLNALPICRLPNKHLSGYSYGAGTPTFRHHSHLDPLEPIAAMDRYKGLQLEHYVTSKFDFKNPSFKAVYDALNSFLYAILTNRSFVLLDDCGHQCVTDQNALARKAWMTDVSLTFLDENIDSNTVEKTLFETEQPYISMADEAVISLQFGKEHYSLLEWTNAFRNSTIDSHDKLEQLFAKGQRFLYGLLFHGLFDIYERTEAPWSESPSASIVVDLESSRFSSENMQECLTPMIPTPGLTSPEPCHLFLISSENTTSRKEANFTSTRCTSSLVDLPNHDKLDKNGWRTLDFVARARTGWLSPEKSKLMPSTESLIKERIEFYRYRETWKLGRDPFFIENLKECIY